MECFFVSCCKLELVNDKYNNLLIYDSSQLLACALACRALPWEAHRYNSESIDALIDRNSSAHEFESEGNAMAEAFMLAAKKRIGLLESSMIDIQCFFFASIYEKYCLRPLQSWFYIQQASSRLQSHLLEREQGNWMSAGSLRSSTHDHLKSRLFWSCYKAETYVNEPPP
jgi:hypothetical protein